MPDNISTDEDSYAWNPNAPTPQMEPRRPDNTDAWKLIDFSPFSERSFHWLENDNLKNTRMKLVVHERSNDILEFKEVIGNEVKVRDGRRTTLVPIETVRAVRPKEVGDLVTPLTGPMAGMALKVRSFEMDDCVVRRPGTVLRKNETDPRFPTACLIQIFPYPKS